jgi:hypothetical protein
LQLKIDRRKQTVSESIYPVGRRKTIEEDKSAAAETEL